MATFTEDELSDYTKVEQLIAKLEKLPDANKLKAQIAMLREAWSTHNRGYGLVWNKHDTKEALNDMYPALTHISETGKKSHTPHLLIEGDNYHSLLVLNWTHRAMFDAIYIDPPYNTNNKEFIYNDSYIDSADAYRHSKWLSFMEKRLTLALPLLKSTGVIFISIDEHEFAQLKLLCDSIFGEHNYVENFIWVKNSTKNNSKTSSCNHEYILCYAKNISLLSGERDKFRVAKPGYKEACELYDKLKAQKLSNDDIAKQLTEMYKRLNLDGGISSYTYVDNKGIYSRADLSAPGGDGGTYDVYHPITKLPCKRSNSGWRYTEDTMKQYIANELVSFGSDHTTVPRFKRYLNTVDSDVVKSVIYDSTEGKKELIDIFKESPFNNPKPVSLIESLLNMVCPKDGLVLDFFAGSGTTGHAVMKLNSLDGGSRRCVICTNNEISEKAKRELDKKKILDASDREQYGICRSVTMPRLNSVITGYTNSMGKSITGLAQSFSHVSIEMVEKHRNPRQQLDAFRSKADYLVWLKEDMFNPEVQSSATGQWTIGYTASKAIAVCNSELSIESCKVISQQLSTMTAVVKKIYVVAEGEDVQVANYLQDISNKCGGIVIETIPHDIIATYEKQKRKAK